MARPIPFDAPPRDPRVELQHRLDRAPIQHAEALLSAYDLLQKLHDKGALDMARGLIGSGEKRRPARCATASFCSTSWAASTPTR